MVPPITRNDSPSPCCTIVGPVHKGEWMTGQDAIIAYKFVTSFYCPECSSPLREPDRGVTLIYAAWPPPYLEKCAKCGLRFDIDVNRMSKAAFHEWYIGAHRGHDIDCAICTWIAQWIRDSCYLWARTAFSGADLRDGGGIDACLGTVMDDPTMHRLTLLRRGPNEAMDDAYKIAWAMRERLEQIAVRRARRDKPPASGGMTPTE